MHRTMDIESAQVCEIILRLRAHVARDPSISKRAADRFMLTTSRLIARLVFEPHETGSQDSALKA